MQTDKDARSDSLAAEDFRSSWVMRSEHRNLLQKYVFSIVSALFVLSGSYVYISDLGVSENIGGIIVCFGMYLFLLKMVNLYTDQQQLAVHYIRNAQTHRLAIKDRPKTLSLKGVSLYTRQRSNPGVINYFIPNWPSKTEYGLVTAMIFCSFLPICFSFLFWKNIIYDVNAPNGKQYIEVIHLTGVCLVEMMAALWILSRSLLNLYSPLSTAKIVSPDNPAPVMLKTPTIPMPLGENIEDNFRRSSSLLSAVSLCLMIALLPFVFFMWPYGLNGNLANYSQFWADVMKFAMLPTPYVVLIFFCLHINRYYFGNDLYRRSNLAIFAAYVLYVLLVAFFVGIAILAMLKVIKLNPIYLYIYLAAGVSIGSLYKFYRHTKSKTNKKIKSLSIFYVVMTFIFAGVLIYNKSFNSRVNEDLIKALTLLAIALLFYFVLLLVPRAIMMFAEGDKCLSGRKFKDKLSISLIRMSSRGISIYLVGIFLSLVAILIGSSLGISKASNLFPSNNVIGYYYTIGGIFISIVCILLIGPAYIETFISAKCFSLIKEDGPESRSKYLALVLMGWAIGFILLCVTWTFSHRPYVYLILALSVAYLLYSFIFCRKDYFTFNSRMYHISVSFFIVSIISVWIISANREKSLFDYLQSIFNFKMLVIEGSPIEYSIFPYANLLIFIILFVMVLFNYLNASGLRSEYYQHKFIDPQLSEKRAWPTKQWSADRPKKRIFLYAKLLLLGLLILMYTILEGTNLLFTIPFVIFLVYLTLSDFLFQRELLFCASWKTEFMGLHLIADRCKDDNSFRRLQEQLGSYKRVDVKAINSHLQCFKRKTNNKEKHTILLRRAIRRSIDNSFMTTLRQRMSDLFIVEHGISSPVLYSKETTIHRFNPNGHIMARKLRWISKSNPILRPLITLCLIPWSKELYLLYDQLGQPKNVWRQRARVLSNVPLHSSLLQGEGAKIEIVFMLSSHTTYGQIVLSKLALDLNKHFCFEHPRNRFRFVAPIGSDVFQRYTIPYIYKVKDDRNFGLDFIFNFIKAKDTIYQYYHRNNIERLRPDVMILSDSSLYNIELAKCARSVNSKILIIYYSPATVEAFTYSNDSRTYDILMSCDYVFTHSYLQQKLFEKCFDDNKNTISLQVKTKECISRITHPLLFVLHEQIKDYVATCPIVRRLGYIVSDVESEWKWSLPFLHFIFSSMYKNQVDENSDIFENLNVFLPSMEAVKRLSMYIGSLKDGYRDKQGKQYLEHIAINDKIKFYCKIEREFDDNIAPVYVDHLGTVSFKHLCDFIKESSHLIGSDKHQATYASYFRPTKCVHFLTFSSLFIMKKVNYELYDPRRKDFKEPLSINNLICSSVINENGIEGDAEVPYPIFYTNWLLYNEGKEIPHNFRDIFVFCFLSNIDDRLSKLAGKTLFLSSWSDSYKYLDTVRGLLNKHFFVNNDNGDFFTNPCDEVIKAIQSHFDFLMDD